MGRDAVVTALFLICVFAPDPPAAAAGRDDERAATEHYTLGSNAFEASDFSRAVDELTTSLAARPSLRAYLLRGDANVKLSRFDAARADYEAALRLEPGTRKRATIERSIRDLATATQTQLAVTSDPPGATVYVDLKAAGQRGVTPVVIPTSPGRHRVFVELDGYEPFVAREVNAVEDRETRLSATLVVKGCDLKLAATPEGASASLDGAAPRPLPLTVRVRAGEHLIRLQHPRALSRQKTVTCTVGTPLELTEALDAIPPGRLVVSVAGVASARLRVDGRRANDTAVDVAPGDHRVGIEAPDHEPWEAAVHVDSGQEIRLAPSLAERRNGRVWSSPWLWTGVGIAVAGVAIGVGLGVGLSGSSAPPIGHFGGQHIFRLSLGGDRL